MSKVSARRPFFKNAGLGARQPLKKKKKKKKCPDLVCDKHFSALDIAINMIQQHFAGDFHVKAGEPVKQ